MGLLDQILFVTGTLFCSVRFSGYVHRNTYRHGFSLLDLISLGFLNFRLSRALTRSELARNN